MLITEIFGSIQGEGMRTGLPTVFVRLARCPYRCTWCDSEYTFTGGLSMSLEAVLEQTQTLAAHANVCITGGEPLAQRRAVMELSEALLADPDRPSVEIETSGGLAIWQVPDPRLHWDLDVKCPGSGMQQHFVAGNLRCLRSGDEVKFVLVDRDDFDFARGFIRERLSETPAGVFLQPAWGQLDPAMAAAWLREEALPGVRLSLQLHKYIWGAEARGV
jgi:7-carboxy-7-deazaguanine synthase